MNIWEKIQYVQARMTTNELLAQLAEESIEVAKAALKARRALSLENPTPVSFADAKADLEEELQDFANILYVLEPECCSKDINELSVSLPCHWGKLERWYDRIREAEKAKDEKEED